MFVTTATSQRSKPSPSRRMPPRPASNTPASTWGCSSALRALRGPLQSPSSMRRPPTKMPSVVVSPTTRPPPPSRYFIRRVTIDLPFVPVTLTIGIRPLSSGGNNIPTIASPTGRGSPTEGLRCMTSPGPALTSTTTAPCSSRGREMSVATMSRPAISRPMVWAASTACSATVGCTSSVQSIERLSFRCTSTLSPSGGTESGVNPWRSSCSSVTGSNSMKLSGKVSSSPRRGSEFNWASIRSRRVLRPSATTEHASPRTAATSLFPTTSKRCSSPGANRSTSTPDPSRAAA